MIKKINSTKRSANSNALNRRFHNSQNEFSIKIVDLSDVSSPKRVMLYIQNTSASFDEDILIWKEFYFGPKNTLYKTFDFWGEYSATGYLGSNYLFEINVINGKKYRVNEAGTSLELMGNASSGSQIQFVNNKDQSLILIVKKLNSILSNVTLSPNATKAYSFKPTIYIAATTDLINSYDFSNVNTEISLIGVSSAHINITHGSVQPYQFTLSNIVFS